MVGVYQRDQSKTTVSQKLDHILYRKIKKTDMNTQKKKVKMFNRISIADSERIPKPPLTSAVVCPAA